MTTTAKLDESASTLVVGVAIVAYSICSSTLLLANKFVTLHISSTVVISLIQLIFTSLTLLIIKGLNIEKIDDFEWTKVKGYLILTIFFFASIFTNIKALAISNVETVIVFRSCSPIAICFIEYLFLERELPSLRSTLSLAGVACGAIFYCMQESSLQFQGWAGYTWVLIYFCTISLDMTYGKLLSQSVKMESVWGSVYYCNVLAILPFLCMGIYEGDLTDKLLEVQNLSWMVMSVLIFSCIVGTFIGYTGWLCRNMLSATTYSLIGVINKFLTIFLNVILWDKHSSTMGLIAVCLCLGCGVFYEQAPRRQVEHLNSKAPIDTKPDLESK